MRKNLPLFLLSIFCTITCLAQNIGIGTDSPSATAKLEIADSSKGILIPRMDSVHRKNIPNTVGLLIYDSTTNSFWYNDGLAWKNLLSSKYSVSTPVTASLQFPDGIENITPVLLNNLNTNPYTIPSGKNFYIMSFYIVGNSTIFLPGVGMSFANGPTDLGLSIFGNGSSISASNDNTNITGFLVDAYVTPIYSNTSFTVPEGRTLVIINSYNSNSYTINSMNFTGNINSSKGRLPVVVKSGDSVDFGGYFTGYLK